MWLWPEESMTVVCRLPAHGFGFAPGLQSQVVAACAPAGIASSTTAAAADSASTARRLSRPSMDLPPAYPRVGSGPMEDWLDPCLDAEEMRATDAWAIKERGVPSLELMETAGRAVAEAAAQVATSGSAAIVCGKGNNGGDGLVAARALRQTGFEVDALLLAPP